MLGNETIFQPRQVKLTADQWTMLKAASPGYEIHHELGKDHESLCCLRAMTAEDHRGKGHKKFVHGLPYSRAVLNLAFWLENLTAEQFEHFAELRLLGI